MGQETNRLTSNRITVIDALRGFALLGVILTHMLQHYGIFSFSAMGQEEALFPKLDIAIQWMLRNVIMGKFINIFAFLFGLSFFIQMDRAAKKGIDFRKRFFWRMIVLLVIGIIGNCFYTGEILSIYAVFGMFIVFLYKFKNWMLFSFIALLLVGAPRIITTSYEQMVKVEQPANSTNAQNGQNRMSVRSQRAPVEDSFLNSAKNNLTRGMEGKLNYQFGVNGRGYITLALFILGLIVGKLRFFEEVHTRKRRNVLLLIGFTSACIVVNVIISLFGDQPSARSILMGAGSSGVPFGLFTVMALRDIYSVLFSGFLVMGFITLYQIKSIGNYLSVLTSYGKMGLTNYEVQGMIGCFMFSTWAFGSVFGGMGATELFALGLFVYAVQVVVSRFWLKYYLYGPLEWLWRSATYLKLQPLRKK